MNNTRPLSSKSLLCSGYPYKSVFPFIYTVIFLSQSIKPKHDLIAQAIKKCATSFVSLTSDNSKLYINKINKMQKSFITMQLLLNINKRLYFTLSKAEWTYVLLGVCVWEGVECLISFLGKPIWLIIVVITKDGCPLTVTLLSVKGALGA